MNGTAPLLACLVLAAGPSPGRAAEPVVGELPPVAKKVLAAAEAVELLSIDKPAGPADRKPGEAERFHENAVLGSTTVTGRAAVAKLVGQIEKGVTDATILDKALCFHPRHGLRAKAGGSVVELVICYECGQINVYLDGK